MRAKGVESLGLFLALAVAGVTVGGLVGCGAGQKPSAQQPMAQEAKNGESEGPQAKEKLAPGDMAGKVAEEQPASEGVPSRGMAGGGRMMSEDREGGGRSRSRTLSESRSKKAASKGGPEVTLETGATHGARAQAAAERGDIDRGGYGRVFRQHTAQIRACYQRALVSEPELKGKLALRFTIEPDGKVSRVQEVSSSLGDSSAARNLVACSQRKGESWVFPVSAGVVRIVYPYILRP